MRKEKNLVAFISVLAAIFLTTFKIIVGVITGSLGILSEAFHSGLDLVAAVITMVAVRISGKPQDEDHGKIENFSALIETMLLLATSGWIIFKAIERISSGRGLELTTTEFSVGILVVITSMVIDFWRSRKLMKVAKKHKSQALEADALHFSTDIWSSAVVLVAVKIYEYTHWGFLFYADSVAALIVAVIVIFVCYSLSKRAINTLLDAAPKQETKDIHKIVSNHDGVKNYHDLRVRQSGHQLMIEVTIHVDHRLNIVEAHEISEKLEEKILQYNQHSIVSVHYEPDTHDHK